jgi:hypothetical protein
VFFGGSETVCGSSIGTPSAANRTRLQEIGAVDIDLAQTSVKSLVLPQRKEVGKLVN